MINMRLTKNNHIVKPKCEIEKVDGLTKATYQENLRDRNPKVREAALTALAKFTA